MLQLSVRVAALGFSKSAFAISVLIVAFDGSVLAAVKVKDAIASCSKPCGLREFSPSLWHDIHFSLSSRAEESTKAACNHSAGFKLLPAWQLLQSESSACCAVRFPGFIKS